MKPELQQAVDEVSRNIPYELVHAMVGPFGTHRVRCPSCASGPIKLYDNNVGVCTVCSKTHNKTEIMQHTLHASPEVLAALDLPRAQGDRYDVEELTAIVEMLRASGVKFFQYKDLNLSFDGAGKTGGTETALRNPALKRLLGGGP